MPPNPHLKPTAKQTLDGILHQAVSSRQTPAVFLGATNEEEEVYWACEGEKEFGEGGEEVTEDTGECGEGVMWEEVGGGVMTRADEVGSWLDGQCCSCGR